jgi:hypothetical protein
VLAEALCPQETQRAEAASEPIITAFVPMDQAVQEAPMRQ